MGLENARGGLPPGFREVLARAIADAIFDEELARAVVADSEGARTGRGRRNVSALLARRKAEKESA